MAKLLLLVKGELTRLHKYKVTHVSIALLVIWFLLLFFIEDEVVLGQLLPFIIMVDATMMSILFVGSILFFEKSEQTLSTILVTPTSNHAKILSKVIANTIQMLLSSVLLVLIFYFVKGIEVRFLSIILLLALSIFSHSLIGFLFSYWSKSFTSMLMLVMSYSFIFMIPSALFQFKIFFEADFWQYVLLISPTQSITYLIEFGLGKPFDMITLIALLWMITFSILLYIFVVYPKYKPYAVKQSGV
ncbi:MAG: ABC transporter permease [Acholeplasma sp.]